MTAHGGDIAAAARRWGIPAGEWLDLSTGINPVPWPVPRPPESVWHRLPDDDGRLEAAAADYYGTDQLLAVPGSQAAIQALPTALDARGWRVGITHPGYAEHAAAWSAAGCEVVPVPPEGPADLHGLDALVVIQPNNPTGATIPAERLAAWRESLAARGGWLVIDAAFADSGEGPTGTEEVGAPGLVVLRSVGKFFGLAGIRLGFALAPPGVRRTLAEQMGPWSVSGPARWAGAGALADTAWQAEARARLTADSARLAGLLRDADLPPAGSTPLFQYVETERAVAVEEALARRAIRVRRFDHPPALRFGLPGAEVDWQRLTIALQEITPEEIAP